MASATPGWSLRLADIFGARIDELTEADLERVVSGRVREDIDLDFKEDRYGGSDGAKRELAADLAALANERGGVIVIGVRDENDVAVARTPVELVEGEEGRIRQTAASNIAPHLAFDVRVVESLEQPGRGYYLFVVPPSDLRPHAVRKDRDLRYPRRDGTTTRWLSEPEVADTYRSRFTRAGDQAGRVGQVLDEGLAAMNVSEEPFIAVGLVPTGTGSMAINLAMVDVLAGWAKDQGPARWFEGFFDQQAPPVAGVAAHRVTLRTIYETDTRPAWQYAELYDDGAGFACTRLLDPRRAWQGATQEGSWIANEDLLYALGRCLLLVGRHAGENCGAWGDALLEARVIGQAPMLLTYLDQFRHPEPVRGGHAVASGFAARRTAVVDGLARPGPPHLATTRMLATDLFHAFGSPEVRQITAEGALRIRYFHGDQPQLTEWAAARDIDVTIETVAGE